MNGMQQQTWDWDALDFGLPGFDFSVGAWLAWYTDCTGLDMGWGEP
jgi:hypothetical protein